MPIEYYSGEPTITVENAEELYEALDILHTQILDTCGDGRGGVRASLDDQGSNSND